MTMIWELLRIELNICATCNTYWCSRYSMCHPSPIWLFVHIMLCCKSCVSTGLIYMLDSIHVQIILKCMSAMGVCKIIHLIRYHTHKHPTFSSRCSALFNLILAKIFSSDIKNESFQCRYNDIRKRTLIWWWDLVVEFSQYKDKLKHYGHSVTAQLC